MLRLTLTNKQEADLRVVCDLSPAQFNAVLARLNEERTSLTSPKSFGELLDAVLGKTLAAAVSRQIFALLSLARGTRTAISEVIDALGVAVSNKGWAAEDLAKFEAAKPLMLGLLQHERIRITAKALELAFNFNKIFTNAEILVDLRPVFDPDHDDIKGMLISHKLRLYLTSDKGHESHTIAMDEKDVRRLHASCTEALKKADKAKAFIGSGCNIEAFIVGETFYE